MMKPPNKKASGFDPSIHTEAKPSSICRDCVPSLISNFHCVCYKAVQQKSDRCKPCSNSNSGRRTRCWAIVGGQYDPEAEEFIAAYTKVRTMDSSSEPDAAKAAAVEKWRQTGVALRNKMTTVEKSDPALRSSRQLKAPETPMAPETPKTPETPKAPEAFMALETPKAPEAFMALETSKSNSLQPVVYRSQGRARLSQPTTGSLDVSSKDAIDNFETLLKQLDFPRDEIFEPTDDPSPAGDYVQTIQRNVTIAMRALEALRKRVDKVRSSPIETAEALLWKPTADRRLVLQMDIADLNSNINNLRDQIDIPRYGRPGNYPVFTNKRYLNPFWLDGACALDRPPIKKSDRPLIKNSDHPVDGSSPAHKRARMASPVNNLTMITDTNTFVDDDTVMGPPSSGDGGRDLLGVLDNSPQSSESFQNRMHNWVDQIDETQEPGVDEDGDIAN